VLRQANAGQSAARNAGAREATGEFLAFLDQDDLWLPQKLTLQVQKLEVDPSVDICHRLGRLTRTLRLRIGRFSAVKVS